MNDVLVFSSCTARKNDSVSVGDVRIQPSDYLGEGALLRELLKVRNEILSRPGAKRGNRETYAFDLYVQTGRMYKRVYEHYYRKMKQVLLDPGTPVQWFFLSGAYGIIHALEPALSYQATFSRSIASQNHIPFTGKLWQRALPEICGHVIGRYPGCKVYVFGSRDYTEFLKHSRLPSETKIIESTGNVGSTRLSPVIATFASALLSHDLPAFDKEYPERFTKLP